MRIPLPIIQGGMGVGISLSGLASAVANEGGVGVIATAGIGRLESDFYTSFAEANTRALRKEIRKARGKTSGILGVNILVALSNYDELARTAVEEGADIIFSGAGLPLHLPAILNGNRKTKLVPIVSSGRAFRLICRKWKDKYDCLPDAVVVEGPRAGGHLGFKLEQIEDPAYSLETILPDVLREAEHIQSEMSVNIPVIAAGGIYTGADIFRFLKMGASGVQMASRFVTTDECDASEAFKQSYISAERDDIILIKSPVGMPGRAIRNNFLTAVERGEKMPFTCPYHCIITCDYKKSPYCIALALIQAQKGDFRNGFAFAGENAYRAETIVPVKQLIETLLCEYTHASTSAPVAA